MWNYNNIYKFVVVLLEGYTCTIYKKKKKKIVVYIYKLINIQIIGNQWPIV